MDEHISPQINIPPDPNSHNAHNPYANDGSAPEDGNALAQSSYEVADVAESPVGQETAILSSEGVSSDITDAEIVEQLTQQGAHPERAWWTRHRVKVLGAAVVVGGILGGVGVATTGHSSADRRPSTPVAATPFSPATETASVTSPSSTVVHPKPPQSIKTTEQAALPTHEVQTPSVYTYKNLPDFGQEVPSSQEAAGNRSKGIVLMHAKGDNSPGSWRPICNGMMSSITTRGRVVNGVTFNEHCLWEYQNGYLNNITSPQNVTAIIDRQQPNGPPPTEYGWLPLNDPTGTPLPFTQIAVGGGNDFNKPSPNFPDLAIGTFAAGTTTSPAINLDNPKNSMLYASPADIRRLAGSASFNTSVTNASSLQELSNASLVRNKVVLLALINDPVTEEPILVWGVLGATADANNSCSDGASGGAIASINLGISGPIQVSYQIYNSAKETHGKDTVTFQQRKAWIVGAEPRIAAFNGIRNFSIAGFNVIIGTSQQNPQTLRATFATLIA